MFSELRRKFVLYAMFVITIVVTVLIGSINFSYRIRISADANIKLNFIADNDGQIPVPHDEDLQKEMNITPETKFSTRYFTAKVDKNNNVCDLNLENTVLYTHDDAVNYANKIISKNKKRGKIGDLIYLAAPKDYGKIIVFMDFSTQKNELDSLLFYSVSVCILALLAILIMLFMISSKVVMPVVDSVDKQKQFITNASHELKTPLAIISANTEVLELMYEKNEWLESIKNQTKRLDLLIKSMLKLSRTEESVIKMEMAKFDMAQAVRESANNFITAAVGREFTIEADEPVFVEADYDCVMQLTSILLDNAIKYTEKGDKINVKIVKTQKTAELWVSNTGVEMDNEEASRLFERFYRADNSRARTTGGYGIGLSIAKSIMDSHNGKITAQCSENEITFKAIFNI